MQKGRAGDISVAWIEPERAERRTLRTQRTQRTQRTLVIWLPGFSGSKEKMEPYLADLAAAGFVALAYDPYQHGERMVETLDELRARIKGNIRRHFWPILARTAEDVTRVIDWAVERLGVGERVGMGGISAGGDASVAAAALDHRIEAVAAGIATPDWLRPGSFEPPGQPDEAARQDYRRRNPLTNLDAYRHTPAISFQNGALDRQVPPDGSVRFMEALRREIYAGCPERIEAVLHSGVAHAFEDAQWQGSLAWFRRHLAGRGADS